MANKVEYGLEKVHYATFTTDEKGKITYGTPVPLPGAVELSCEPSGDLIEFKADNVTYWSAPNNQGYEGTLTLARLTDEFLQEVLGEEVNEDGVIAERSGIASKPFALMFQFMGDDTDTMHVMYNCSANRPKVGSNTYDSGEVNTSELTFKATPRPSDKLVKMRTSEETSKEVKSAWYNAVYEAGKTEKPEAPDTKNGK